MARIDAARRRDDAGQVWTLAQVEVEIAGIVAQLTPGVDPGAIQRASRFRDDLGWDDWSLLRVVKPVWRRLHETLSDYVVKELRRVGELMDYVWSKMEDVT